MIGRVQDASNTTITVDKWHDLDGNVVLPDAGTYYEVSYRPVYPIHMEYGHRRVRVINNTVKRGWGDQISLYGNDSEVSNNNVIDGQDVGITINGIGSGNGHTLVSNNKIHHQGAAGIFIGPCTNGLIDGNVITATGWENIVNTVTLGGIILAGATKCVVSNNVIDGQNKPLARHGIVLDGVSTDGNLLTDNKVINVSVAGIQIYAAVNTVLRDNDATINHANGAVGGDYGVLTGSAAPESAVIAGPGTEYRRSNGSVYIKTTGTSNTGWKEIVVSGTDGSIVPAVDLTNLGGINKRWNLRTFEIHDGSGNGRIQIAEGAHNFYTARPSDTGAALSHGFDTAVTLTQSGAKLFSVRNNGSEKMYIDKDGTIVPGADLTVLGAANRRYNLKTFEISDNDSGVRLQLPAGLGSSYVGRGSDIAGAVAHNFDAGVTLTAADAKLLRIRNGGSEKLYVNKDGGIIPANDNTDLGAVNKRWTLYTQDVKSAGGATRLSFLEGSTNWHVDGRLNAADAVCHHFDSATSQTLSGALLMRIANAGSIKVTIDKDGLINSKGIGLTGPTGSPTGTTINYNRRYS